MFYYSGHGALITGSHSVEEPGEDSAIIPDDYSSGGTFIDDNWLYANLASKVPEGATLWSFTDCCHSGSMIDLHYNWTYSPTLKVNVKKPADVYNESDWQDTFSMTQIKTKETIGDVFSYSGCRDSEISVDTKEENVSQGAFTYSLLKYLKLNPTFRTKSIAYVLKAVNCMLLMENYSQRSILSVGDVGDFNALFNV